MFFSCVIVLLLLPCALLEHGCDLSLENKGIVLLFESFCILVVLLFCYQPLVGINSTLSSNYGQTFRSTNDGKMKEDLILRLL